MTTPATDRHLQMLDRLAEIGMVLAERLHGQPPRPKQDPARDLDIISRVVRRCILLFHLLENDQLPKPRSPAEPKSGTTRTPSAPSGDFRTRLDPIDRLDDVSGPFEHVVATIVADIQTALAADYPDLVEQIRRRLPVPIRHEADTPDLN